MGRGTERGQAIGAITSGDPVLRKNLKAAYTGATTKYTRGSRWSERRKGTPRNEETAGAPHFAAGARCPHWPGFREGKRNPIRISHGGAPPRADYRWASRLGCCYLARGTG